MKLKMKGFLEILLSLTLVLGLVPGMSMTAYAANYSEGDDASIFSISVGDTFDVGSTITRNNSTGVLQEIYVDDYCVFKYYGPGTYTVNENLTLTAVDGVKYYFDSTDTNDLTNATVTVDTAKASTTVKIGDKNVGPAKYDVKYGSTLENATADFPTQAGSYYAFVTAKETADNYIGEAKSAVFTISAADTVTWTSIANNKSENGITVTTSGVNFYGNCISGYNGSMTFTSTVGKIKKIEISCNGDHNMNVFDTSSGWNECYGSGPLVWNGTASDSVTLSAEMIDISEFAQIVYTIEAKSDISDTTVTVDTNNQRVSVTRGNAFIPEDEYTVTYGADAEHATLTDFPTKAGTYVAVVTAKTDSTYYKGSVTSAEFTIPKADVLIVSLPAASAITYGQTLADSALTGGTAKSGDSEVEGIFEWKNKNIKPAVSDSEMTEYDVVFTPEDADNYAMVECKVKLTVNKAAPTVTAPTAKTGLVYTSSAQKLVNTGSTNDGILYYAVTTENTAPTDDNLYSTSIPTGTDAGTYYVWYKVVGDENHSDTTPASVTVTIQRRSSGGGSSTTTVTVPVTSDAAPGTVPVKASVSGTTATVTKLTDEQLAQVTTNKSGNKDADAETETNSVVIDVSGVAKDVKTATIPTETVKAVEETGSNLKVTLTDGSVEFDATAQAIITDEAKGTTIQVNLDAVKVTTLTSAQQSAVESLEVEVVLDAYVTSNGQRISDFKGGSATLSVPYTLKDGQAAQGIVVWYVASDGTRTQVDASYDGKNVVFTVPHFSNYVIAYDAAKAAACPQDTTCPISAFTDARTTAWYHDGVHWAIENSVMNGVGDGKFAPNGITTRAQVVTMLWRLEGSPAYVGMSEFSDVDNEQWYGPAIRWASAEGIVNGYDDGRFGANDAVTREQLVTILYRYAQYKKMDVSVGEDTNILSYDDAFDVSEWAIPAMQWACGSGIVNGIDKNGTLMLAPSDASTRAVVATMFWRFSK